MIYLICLKYKTSLALIRFEKELKNKLSLKASGFQTEESVLVKAFKYFDLDNSGAVSTKEWVRALSKIGITGFSDEDLLSLFSLYDADRSGEIDYKEFIGRVFNNASMATEPARDDRQDTELSKAEYRKRYNLEEIMEKVRAKMTSRGIRGIVSIGKSFRIADDNRSGTLDIDEFLKVSKDYRMGLTEEEVKHIFIGYDTSGDGQIEYDEFLRAVRGNMNGFRRRLCLQAFDKLDRNKSGDIDINDIRGVYNARKHPDVINGKKTEDEVLLEFLDTFEEHHKMQHNSVDDDVITKEEWIEYYENVSMSIDDDKYFELMINNAWRMNEHTTYNNEKRGWAGEDKGPSVSQSYKKTGRAAYRQSEPTQTRQAVQSNNFVSEPTDRSIGARDDGVDVIIKKFRERLFSRGGKGTIGLQRQFKIFDDNNSRTLEMTEFTKAIKDFRIDLTNSEIRRLFNYLDIDRQGSIDYDEFLRQVVGEMNGFRKKIVLKVFDKLDVDKSGVVDCKEIKYFYDAKKHPDVLSGRKSEQEILRSFIETFEMYSTGRNGVKDGQLTKEEFLEYYNNISCNIDNDEYFELMMTNAWKLGPQVDPYGHKRNNGKPVSQNAPFGTTNAPVNYSTSNRPNLGAKKIASGDVLGRFRAKLASRGTKGLTAMRRSFMICDDDNSKTISMDEFSKICKDYRLDFTTEEVKKLFTKFDTTGDGVIDQDEFVRAIVGEMNSFRKNLVKKAFNILDKDGSGKIEVDDIRNVYNAKKHPKVIEGKMTEDEVLAEFLDNLEYHFNILVSF